MKNYYAECIVKYKNTDDDGKPYDDEEYYSFTVEANNRKEGRLQAKMIQKKLDELEALITVQNVDKYPEQSLTAMKALNLIVELRGLVKKLDLHIVSGLLPDTPTYAEWIDKYFTWYRNDDLYKDKRSGKVYYQLELFNRYKNAYKGNEC